jgi:hypothetical protein
MLLDRFGEVIADIMTITPDISGVASASAILDTSNFTFQAVTFGKNSNAFQYHAHQILSPSTLKTFKTTTYSGSSVSAYYTSAIVGNVIGYTLLPECIRPIDTRLENGPTRSNITSAYDPGHYQNSIMSSSLSSYYHLIGGFSASGGTTFWVGTLSSNISVSLVYSGTLSSLINTYGTMDSSGFLTVAPYTANQGNAIGLANWINSGVILTGINPSSTGRIGLGIALGPGDLGSLNLFGGIYSIGLWVLDIKEMLRAGLTPPYSFNALNNIRKYKLVAKRSFLRDLTYHTANFNTTFTGAWTYGDPDPKSLYFTWNINFF